MIPYLVQRNTNTGKQGGSKGLASNTMMIKIVYVEINLPPSPAPSPLYSAYKQSITHLHILDHIAFSKLGSWLQTKLLLELLGGRHGRHRNEEVSGDTAKRGERLVLIGTNGAQKLRLE